MDNLQTDFVQEHIAAAMTLGGEGFAEFLKEDVPVWLSEMPIESPLEAAFVIWWGAAHRMANRCRMLPEKWLRIVPQVTVATKLGHFRLDFVVRPFQATFHPFAKIGVELDGHDFHERTKEQVEQRNRKDRALQAEGWKVFHFSGAEVNARPAHCVLEVRRFAMRALDELTLATSIVP